MARQIGMAKLDTKRKKRRPGQHKKNVNKRNKVKTHFG